jgi:xylulose-5-phosphate/fructose-6-phosphate phosphoketolase
MPDFRQYAVDVTHAGQVEAENTGVMGVFLRDVMRNNMTNFRVFGPDETASNRLAALYEVTKKTWLADTYPEDLDGSQLSPDGRVMEMLSEHTLVGGLFIIRSSRFISLLRGFCSRYRFHVQPTR